MSDIAEEMTAEAGIPYSEQEIGLRDALRDVVDPELGMSIVELGLIRKVDFHPDLTEITMIMTTPFCPYGPALLEQTRRTAEKHLQGPVKITLGMEMWEPSMMEGGPPAEWGLY
ncbi:MAG TPA: iron-sulfur cluster assembly protein [Anaerolineae bacterium]|nr:iron-sulfur cluster assembly protein [Anaerolineae bacterium]